MARSRGVIVLFFVAPLVLAVLWSTRDDSAVALRESGADAVQGDLELVDSELGEPGPLAVAEARGSSGVPTREPLRTRPATIRGWVEVPGGLLMDETVRVAARIAFERPEREERKLGTATVESDGSFVLHLPEGASEARLFADARTLDAGEGVTARPGAAGVVVRAVRRAEIFGRLTLPAGMRVPDGETLGDVRMEWSRVGMEGKQVVYPGSDGRFELPLAPVGVEFELVVDASFALQRAVRIPPLAPGEVRELHVELEAGRTIRGRVLDEYRAAVVDAEVTIGARPSLDAEFADGKLLPKASTDSEGRFVCGGLEPSAWRLSVLAPGRCSEYALVDLAPGDRLGLEVVLRRGRTLAGQVVWDDGTPARGHFDLAVEGGPFCGLDYEDEGRFLLYGLEDQPYRIEAQVRTSSVSASAMVADVLPGGAPIVLVLASTPLAELHGEVVDPSGAPIHGARVSSGAAEAWTSQEGRFTLHRHPGAHELRVAADGYLTCELEQPGAGPARIVLERGIRICGRVVSTNGEPAFGAVVTGRGFEPFEIGSTGAFEVEVSELETSLEASVPDNAISKPLVVKGRSGELVEGVVLRLELSGRIGGRVLAPSGAPCREVFVYWQSASCTASGPTDDSGAFLIRDLPVEAGRLCTTPDEHGRRASLELDLVPGTNEVVLRLPPLDPVLVHLRLTRGGMPAQGRVRLASARFLCEGELDVAGRVSIELPGPSACTGWFLPSEDEDLRRFECSGPGEREIGLEVDSLPRVTWDELDD